MLILWLKSLYNSKTGDYYEIDETFYQILKNINDVLPKTIDECKKIINKFALNSCEVWENLLSEGLLVEFIENKSENILPSKRILYPLTTLIIELSNMCSLNCIHCYGLFGKTTNVQEYSLEEIKQLKKEFDDLHVQSIVLTGGDLFLNKNATDITLFLLKNGFEVTVLANGWGNIKPFCEAVKNYKLSIVFSVDGLEKTHDFIRGKKNSFLHVLESISIANSYDNISIGISTTVMKCNIREMDQFERYMSALYQDIEINKSLMIPVNGVQQSFSIDEFKEAYKICPSVFQTFDKGKERHERCQGGISLGALGADRNVTICTAAKSKEFILGNIQFDSLSHIWIAPPKHIEYMRKEKHLERVQCLQCNNYNKCRTIQDCRVYAKQYTGDISNPNSICCFIASQ